MSSSPTFDHYLNYSEVTAEIAAACESYPQLAVCESIGRSHEGREIWCVSITQSSTGPASDKPAFWVDGNIHATEVSATSACLYLIQYLLGKYGADENVTRCLDTRAFYIVPRVNPDGAELFFSDKPKYLRSSTRPYPYDEEPIEGLVREDIDGDGRMLSMRIADSNGPWKPHPDEPRMLIKREPTEVGGTYYRLLPEGTLLNYDGVCLTVPQNKEGLDLNRNFPAHWRQEGEQHGAGPFPTSEPEVRALVAFIAEHRNITSGVTFHTFSGVLLRPYGTQADDAFPAEDLWTYETIGKKGTEMTGYPAISVYHDFRYHPKEVITGVFDDWMYDHFGLFAWTIEIWCPQREAGIACFGPDKPAEGYKFIDWYRDHPQEDDMKMLTWSDTALKGQGYIDWYPFDHPQLGAIELGGWDPMLAFRNPPPGRIEQEVAKFPGWLVWHALLSPRIVIQSAEVEPLGEGAYVVMVVILNEGYLPTYVTKRALATKVVRGVVATIELEECARLVSGKLREDVGQLEGRAYKSSGSFGWTSDPTEDRVKVQWTLVGKAGSRVKLEVSHERAGRQSIELILPEPQSGLELLPDITDIPK